MTTTIRLFCVCSSKGFGVGEMSADMKESEANVKDVLACKLLAGKYEECGHIKHSMECRRVEGIRPR